MVKDPRDDTELVVVTSVSVLLNVVFGVIDRLIESKTVSRAEILQLLEELKSESPSYEKGEELAIELLDGARYRIDGGYEKPSVAKRADVVPKAARAA